MPGVTFAAVLAVLIFYVVSLIVGVLSYVFQSVGLHRLGNRRGIQYAWMAWLPYANKYLMGRVAEEYDGRQGIKRRWSVLLLVMEIVTQLTGTIVGGIAGITSSAYLYNNTGANLETASALETMDAVNGVLQTLMIACVMLLVVLSISLVKKLCEGVCLFKIYESTVPKRAVVYFILSLLIPMAQSICIFSCRNQGNFKVDETDTTIE